MARTRQLAAIAPKGRALIYPTGRHALASSGQGLHQEAFSAVCWMMLSCPLRDDLLTARDPCRTMRVFQIRPKLTLRAMSGLVALAALVIWGGITASRLYRAARYHRAQAAAHGMYFTRCREDQTAAEAEVPRLQQDIDRVTKNAISVDISNPKHVLKIVQRRALFEASMADYHLQLQQKYEYAASHPWIEVAPDPKSQPEPEPETEHE
jgi:hypothetical protein